MAERTEHIITWEAGWTILKEDFFGVLEGKLNAGVKDRREVFDKRVTGKLYTLVYSMCTQSSPNNWSDRLYPAIFERVTVYLASNVLPALEGKQGEHLLTEFVIRGNAHVIMNWWISYIFMYLDRYHVKFHQLPSLEDAGLRYYKTIVFDAVKADVTAAINDHINEVSRGSMVNTELIRSCIAVYEKMGEIEEAKKLMVLLQEALVCEMDPVLLSVSETAALGCDYLERECETLHGKLKQALTHKNAVVRRDKLKAQLHAAEQSKGHLQLIGTLGLALQSAEQEILQLPAIEEHDYIELLVNHADMIKRVELRGREFIKMKEYALVKRLGDKLKALEGLLSSIEDYDTRMLGAENAEHRIEIRSVRKADSSEFIN